METRILIPEPLKIVLHKKYIKHRSRTTRVSKASSSSNEKETSRIEKPSSSSKILLDNEDSDLNFSSSDDESVSSKNSRNRNRRRSTTANYKLRNRSHRNNSDDHGSGSSSWSNSSGTESDLEKGQGLYASSCTNSDTAIENSDNEQVSGAVSKNSKRKSRRHVRKASYKHIVQVCVRQKIEKGTKLSPNEGEVQVSILKGLESIPKDDVRFVFGCFDRIMEDPSKSTEIIRICNWLRFVPNKISKYDTTINLVAKFVDRKPVFEFTRDLMAGERVVMYLDFESISRESMFDGHLIKSVAQMLEVSTEVPLDLSKSPTSASVKHEHLSRMTSAFSVDHSKHMLKSTSASTSPYSMRNILHSSGLFQPHSHNSRHEPLALTPPLSSSSIAATTTTSSTDSNHSILNSPNSLITTQQHSSLNLFLNKSSGRRFTHNSNLQDVLNHYASTNSAAIGNSSSTLLRPILRTRGRERALLPCEVCSKAFDRPSLLKRHMRTHTGEKPHVCDTCGKGFSTSSSLNTHRRIHSGEKPHQCPICGKRFTASSNLYYHRMTHNKEKPHKCLLCGKSFPTPGDLKSHQYVHSGSWPFSCRICNRGFSKQTNLRNHLLLHSGDKPHTCRICNKKFALACNLRAHLRTHEEDPVSACVSCKRTFINSLNMIVNGQCRHCILKLHPQSQSQSQVSPPSTTIASAFHSNCNSISSGGTLTSDIIIPQPNNISTENSKSSGKKDTHQLPQMPNNFFPISTLHGFHHHLQSASASSSLAAAAAAIAAGSSQPSQNPVFLHSPLEAQFNNFGSRPNPFLEQIFEWNWRVAKETAGNLGMMQQKLFESQMLAAQLMTTTPGSLSDMLRLQSTASAASNRRIPAILSGSSSSDFNLDGISSSKLENCI